MRIKLTLVDGTVQYLETQSFNLCPVKDMIPEILEAKVYTDHGRLLARRRRKNWKHYIEHEYKPLPKPEAPAEAPAEAPQEPPAEAQA